MVVEGSTSSSKRNEKSVVPVAASDIKANDKSSTVAGESNPEKLGVSVPIKKRRFMDRSPSPSKRSDESLTEKPDSRAVTVIEKSSINKITEKNDDGLKNVKFHWDLNLPVEDWGNPSDVIDGIKADEAAAENELEDGELREPYPWADYKGEAEHVDGDASRIREANEGNDSEKHVVINMSDPHSKGSFSSSSSRIFGSQPFKVPSHDVIQRRRPDNYELSSGPARRDDRSSMRMCNMSHGREYSSSWDSKRCFSHPNYNRGSFGFKRARPKNMVDGRGVMINYDQLGSGRGARLYGRGEGSNGRGAGSYGRGEGSNGRGARSYGRGEGSNGRPYGRGEGSNGRPYRRGEGSNGRGARPDERGEEPYGRGAPDDHAPRRYFSNGGFKGQLRKFSDGGDTDTNQFRGPMNNQISATKRDRGNSSVFNRMNYQQSESRFRSYSPFSWNGGSRSSPAPPGGFRADGDQEMSFMSPPRNRMLTQRGENNDNSFSERKSRLGQRSFDVGNSMKRHYSDTNCSCHLRSFIGNRRFEDDAEENTGLKQERTRRSEAMGNGGDDIMRFRFNREHAVVVAADNDNKYNNNKDSKKSHDNK